MTPLASNPEARRALTDAVRYWKVNVAPHAVCEGHQAPLDFLAAWVWDRPSVSLVLGPRGGGKSYLAAVATHLDSIRHDRHGTVILGGSLSQSAQIYQALKEFHQGQRGRSPMLSVTATRASYRTGSDVSILAASPTSVRGPHVASLRLDEVDEIDPDIRESSIGMCMHRNGVSPSISMTSTWHRVGGPMAQLMERGRAGEFPTFTFCAFEALERCPVERSGPELEKCPECPIVKWCHDTASGVPKAKQSSGHYTIDSLIQKVMTVSPRVFEADYLCAGPKADGVWFTAFDRLKHVTEAAEFNPRHPVHVAVDGGVFTGGVLFQARQRGDGRFLVNVFADHLAEGFTAEVNARSVLKLTQERCRGRRDRVVADPSGKSRESTGPPVFAEYLKAGLGDARGRLDGWPSYTGCVRSGLELIDALLMAADGTVGLTVHPRCTHLIAAFQSYRRAKRANQWMDYPEDPQHPHEDLMDALRGGLLDKWPEGRLPPPALVYVPARAVF